MGGPVRDVQLALLDGMERNVGRVPGSVFVGNNSELMAAIAPLYLNGSVLDVTYGNGATAGGWWRLHTPDPFTYHDLQLDGVDFRQLPHTDGEFDTVCFDPPYVPAGGEPTTDIGSQFRQRFGLGWKDGYRSEAVLAELVRDGLAECARAASRYVLVKCMEFVSSGRFHDMPTQVSVWANELGLVKHDVIVHHTGPGIGGNNITEIKRTRRHHSYLLVFTPSSRPVSPVDPSEAVA